MYKTTKRFLKVKNQVMKVKNQVEKIKKNEYFIVQHLRQRKDNDSSKRKSHPREHNKEKKNRNSNIRNLETICKNWAKNF